MNAIATEIRTGMGRKRREQSSISFPYVDLSAATEIARALHRRCGEDACDLNDLAADLHDGAFRLKTSAARIFDLIEKKGRSEARLTEGGRQIVADDANVTARAQAFLKVPLYSAVFEKFQGTRLPSRHVLEEEMKHLGVPEKQVDKARQVFERSARQAGLFEVSDNRLAWPSENQPQIRNNLPIAPSVMMDTEGRLENYIAEVTSHGRMNREDPLIVGLVNRLPTAGSAWSDESRIAWLRLANSIFDVTYSAGSGTIKIGMDDAVEPDRDN